MSETNDSDEAQGVVSSESVESPRPAPVCAAPCNVCEGMDHHWLPDCPDDIPIMVCKHCDAVREMTDDDDEF